MNANIICNMHAKYSMLCMHTRVLCAVLTMFSGCIQLFDVQANASSMCMHEHLTTNLNNIS